MHLRIHPRASFLLYRTAARPRGFMSMSDPTEHAPERPAPPIRLHHSIMLAADPAVASVCLGPLAPRYALILLNNATLSAPLVERLWSRCALVLCADGAAKRLRDLPLRPPIAAPAAYRPHAIVGDMDSLDDDTAEHYRSQGVPIHWVGDQDSTDLDKCLSFAASRQREGMDKGVMRSPYRVLICGCFGGRFDHELGALHSLCAWNSRFTSIQLLDDGNACTVLSAGSHLLLPTAGVDGPHCGLVPVQGPVAGVTTTGLQWNLADQRLEMGVFISVCNKIDPEVFWRPGQRSAEIIERIVSGVTESGSLSAEHIEDASERTRGVFVNTTGPLLWTNSISL